jgi:hypothetical protein
MAGKIWKTLGLIVSIGLILGGLAGLSGIIVLPGTNSSQALLGFGVLILIVDIQSIVTHKAREAKEAAAKKITAKEAAAKIQSDGRVNTGKTSIKPPTVNASKSKPKSEIKVVDLQPNTLRKLKLGMSSAEVKSLIGEPSFINPAEKAMQSMFGRGQTMIIGSSIDSFMASQSTKEYWLYKTPVGDFQMLMDAGKISAFSGLDFIIKKLENAGASG